MIKCEFGDRRPINPFVKPTPAYYRKRRTKNKLKKVRDSILYNLKHNTLPTYFDTMKELQDIEGELNTIAKQYGCKFVKDRTDWRLHELTELDNDDVFSLIKENK